MVRQQTTSTTEALPPKPLCSNRKSDRTRSRSPRPSDGNVSDSSRKRLHFDDRSVSDGEDRIDIDDPAQFPNLTGASAPARYSYLLTNFDTKFQNPKQLLLQFTKYVCRSDISQIIYTKNGAIIKSPDNNLATKIRNRHSFEIFGKTATMSQMAHPRVKQPPPPRKAPLLSVVIRGIDPILTDEEILDELRLEGHSLEKCIRIRNATGPTFMVRVLTDSQDTINDLLSTGAYVYKRRHRVEPSHTPPPAPIRCEKCQLYNSHPTAQCPNQLKCGYCSGQHATKSCPNLQLPPKCNTCNDTHPTFSYKCKAKPAPEPGKPELIVPIRTHIASTACDPVPVSPCQPVTVDQLLSFLTLAMQNIHPFDRPFVLQQIQFAAKSIFHVTFNATYSGPYAHFHARETSV